MSTALARVSTGEDVTREDALADLNSAKQRRFVEAYVGAARGNATEAARMAGYSGSYSTVGYKNIRKDHIKRAVRALVRAETLSRSEVRHRLSQQATASSDDVVDQVCVTHYVAHDPTEADELADVLSRGVGAPRVTYLGPSDIEPGIARALEASPAQLEQAMEAGSLQIARVEVEVMVVNLEKARRTGAIHAIKSIRYDHNGRPEITMYDSQKALMHLDKMYSVADNAPEAATVARSRLERVTDKMGLQVNVLNVNL